MEQEALLNNFNTQLDEYTRHREYIRRARAQAAKFSSGVVEKVILDHEIKSSETADLVLPMVPEIEAGIAIIDEERGGIERDKGAADEQMEELQLRQAIGELSEEGFEEASKELRALLDSASARLEELQADRAKLSTALDRWVELAAEAGQANGLSGAASDGAPTEVAPDEEEEDRGEASVVEEDISIASVEDDGGYVSATPVQDDVSPVFDQGVTQVDDGGEAIEAGDADVDFGFDEEGEVGIVEESDAGEIVGEDVEVALGGVEHAEAVEAGDEIGVDLEGGAQEKAGEGEPEEGFRRALLLYQEGTAEEQIYPFTGEVLTIGRGRDNDIQIKNDSKVSRFHCRLFRRGNTFYVEDNKSSNGTLVNGELITERRLFGGEEVIIGETFFRFRIM